MEIQSYFKIEKKYVNKNFLKVARKLDFEKKSRPRVDAPLKVTEVNRNVKYQTYHTSRNEKCFQNFILT